VKRLVLNIKQGLGFIGMLRTHSRAELIDDYAVGFTVIFKSVFVINMRNDCY